MSGWGAIYGSMTTGLQRSSQVLTSLQEQLALGSKVIRASDSPSDAFHIMNLQFHTRSMETYAKNLDWN